MNALMNAMVEKLDMMTAQVVIIDKAQAQMNWEDELDAMGISEPLSVYEMHLAKVPDVDAPMTSYLEGFITGQSTRNLLRA